MSSKTAVQIDISVYQNAETGEFFEDDDVEVTRDGYDANWLYHGNKVMREVTLVEALNILHRKNIELERRLNSMGDDGK